MTLGKTYMSSFFNANIRLTKEDYSIPGCSRPSMEHGRGVEHHWYINSLLWSKEADKSDNPQRCRVFWALWITGEYYRVKRHVFATEWVYLQQH